MDFPPRSWDELGDWLHALSLVRERSTGDLTSESLGRFHSLDDVFQWIAEYEMPAAEEIERCVERLSLGEEEAIRDLSPLGWEVLRLRISAASYWIPTLAGEDSPIEFPDIPFARLFRWLLISWWDKHGRMNASEELALMWAFDS